MKKSLLLPLLFLLLLAITHYAQAEETKTSQWNGFQREHFTIDGKSCYVVKPIEPAPGRPWVWRARFPGYHTEIDLILLKSGFHVAHINTGGMLGCDKAMDIWDKFYNHMVGKPYGLAKTVALEGVSRGGLFVYRWAARNPEKVACIYADTPVCDFKSWPLGKGKGIGHQSTWKNLLKQYDINEEQALAYKRNPIDVLDPIAKARVPILHIVSESDTVVPPTENTYELQKRYLKLGGHMRVMSVEKGTAGSHGHHFTHPDPMTPAEFIINHATGPKDWFIVRGTLDNCRLKFEREKQGRVVFLGGSITNMNGWRDMVCAELQRRFPETKFDFVNGGISSTGSTPGAFRLLRDVFGRGPVDLLFEEAAVNDSTNFRTPTEMLRGMEGIVRHARLVNPKIDVVMMHFVDPSKMAQYNKGRQPIVITQHEKVARHYGVTSIDLALEVTQRIGAGEFTWRDDFKNLHPSPFGQKLYSATIARLLDHAWSKPLAKDAKPTDHAIPEPLDKFSYHGGKLVSPNAAQLGEGWKLDPAWKPSTPSGTRGGFVNVPMAVTEKPGAELSLKFSGSAVGIFVAAGRDAGTVEYRVDEGPWLEQDLFTRWSRSLHIPWAYVLSAELATGPHTLTLRVSKSKNPKSTGHAVRIVHFLVSE
jgi:sialidase-1